MKEDNKFESRNLDKPFDVVATLNHIEDNIHSGPVELTLTNDNLPEDEKKLKIRITSQTQLKEINSLLLTRLSYGGTHVAIE